MSATFHRKQPVVVFPIVVVLLLYISQLSATAGIIYVNQNATGANTGLNWEDAFTTFRAAAEAAIRGDSIFVAAGTYSPVSDFDNIFLEARRTYRFGFPVSIFGHFAGTENDPDERDLNNPDHETIFDGEHKSKSIFFFDERYFQHGSSNNPENVPVCLDGLTLMRGNASADVNLPGYYENRDAGGAIFIDRSISLNHCKILDMIGGSAIFVLDVDYQNSITQLTNCYFKDGPYGLNTYGQVILENCRFENLGKGVDLRAVNPAIISNTEFVEVDQPINTWPSKSITLRDLKISGSKKRSRISTDTLLIERGRFSGNIGGVFIFHLNTLKLIASNLRATRR